MNEQTQVQEAEGGFAGKLTVAVAIALLIAGIAAFYLLDTRPDWQRWSTAALGLVAGLAVFAVSPVGRRSWQFVLDSRVELRKVVWPTKSETINYSLIVLVAIVVMTTLIFAVDYVFSQAVLKLFNA
mgnify:CR=1 FL=1